MKCPHCNDSIFVDFQYAYLARPGNRVFAKSWTAGYAYCPSCSLPIVHLVEQLLPMTGDVPDKKKTLHNVFPKAPYREGPPAEVKADIAEGFGQALDVLPVSPMASAALSRRCLQAVLRHAGYSQKDLIDQVRAVLAEQDASKSLPSYLHDSLDAIRNFGNFSAHPITELTALQVIPVEPNEAEWCIEILRELFDHYFVKPARAQKAKAALNNKLQSAGKPKAL